MLFLGAWLGGPARWWLWVLGAAVLGGALWLAARGWRRELREAEARRDEVATQLDRRISELFSLQELGYILSGSLELERIVEQVVGFAARFLQTEGAIVALSPDGGIVATGGKSIRLYDSRTGKLLRELYGHLKRTQAITFSSEPNSPSHLAAVFGPTPARPGMLSDVSPTSAR